MKAGCAKEMTVSTGTAEEAEALELASLCRLVLLVNLYQRTTFIQYNGYTLHLREHFPSCEVLISHFEESNVDMTFLCACLCLFRFKLNVCHKDYKIKRTGHSGLMGAYSKMQIQKV